MAGHNISVQPKLLFNPTNTDNQKEVSKVPETPKEYKELNVQDATLNTPEEELEIAEKHNPAPPTIRSSNPMVRDSLFKKLDQELSEEWGSKNIHRFSI